MTSNAVTNRIVFGKMSHPSDHDSHKICRQNFSIVSMKCERNFTCPKLTFALKENHARKENANRRTLRLFANNFSVCAQLYGSCGTFEKTRK